MDSADLFGSNPHMAPARTRDSACPYGACDGSGYVLREDDDVAVPCRCREQRVARGRARRLASKVPKKFRGVAFDRHPVNKMDPSVVRGIASFCRRLDRHLEEGDSLGFYGTPGTGKTTLAMLVSIEALRLNRTVGIYTGPELMNAIRQTYEESSAATYEQLMESLLAVDLLHIEDLAVVRTNEWVLEQLYTVINARYQDGKSIVFTAEVQKTPEELAGLIGARTFSRLVEMCGDRLIPMFGRDNRWGAPADDLVEAELFQ